MVVDAVSGVEVVEVAGSGGGGGGGYRIWRWRLVGASLSLVKGRGGTSEGRVPLPIR